jgi:hypothetical protein
LGPTLAPSTLGPKGRRDHSTWDFAEIPNLEK